MTPVDAVNLTSLPSPHALTFKPVYSKQSIKGIVSLYYVNTLHGSAVPGGFMFYWWCNFYFFCSTRNIRVPSAKRRETLPHDWKFTQFYKPCFTVLAPSPQNCRGDKRVKLGAILANFRHRIANICWTDQNTESRKPRDRPLSLTRPTKKVRWTLVH